MARLSLPTGLQALITKYGKNQEDAIANCLELGPQPPPLISELLPSDIVVAVRATEVVWTDTVMATGQYQHQAKVPYSPGMTYSGVVAWAGPEARAAGVHEGKRVAIGVIGGNATRPRHNYHHHRRTRTHPRRTQGGGALFWRCHQRHTQNTSR